MVNISFILNHHNQLAWKEYNGKHDTSKDDKKLSFMKSSCGLKSIGNIENSQVVKKIMMTIIIHVNMAKKKKP